MLRREGKMMTVAAAGGALLALIGAGCAGIQTRQKEPQARQFVYLMKFDKAGQPDKAALLARTIQVVRQRLGDQGSVEPQGDDRFVVKLPRQITGDDAQRLDWLITSRGLLLFCLVDNDAKDWADARRGETVRGHTPFLPVLDAEGRIKRDASGRIKRWHRATYNQTKEFLESHPEMRDTSDWFLVENKPGVTGEYLRSAQPTQDQSGLPAVWFTFRDKGRLDLEELTNNNAGRLLAIILDDDLYSAPVIQSRISASGIITGSFTRGEVDDLVTALNAGQLPVLVERVSDNAQLTKP